MTRQEILKAANRLVRREGVVRLTIEAVAQEAGLSKGGVLYHFPSKDALVSAMITYMMDGFEQGMARIQNKPDAEPGSWSRAFVKATEQLETEEPDVIFSLIAAIAVNQQLLDPVRQRYQDWQNQLENDGIDPARATLVRLAADGLYLADMLGFAPPRGELRQQVIELLLEMTKKEQ